MQQGDKFTTNLKKTHTQTRVHVYTQKDPRCIGIGRLTHTYFKHILAPPDIGTQQLSVLHLMNNLLLSKFT